MDTRDPYDDPETPFIPTLGAKPRPTTKGRKLSRRTICTALAGISLLGFGFFLLKPSSYLDTQDVPSYSAASNSPSYLQGPPTQRFRGQLIGQNVTSISQ